jgi:hypothetical protein
MSLLNDWNLADTVLGLCFDTTASNSGVHQGACKLIEQDIGRPLFYFPCRHHVAELHIKHASTAVRGMTKSPCDLLFKRFKEDFGNLNQSNVKYWTWPANRDGFLARKATEDKHWTEDRLKKGTFPRDDYLELCELIVIYFGGRTGRKFFIRKPGAHHHARFMAKRFAPSIYFLKMFLLSDAFQLSAKEKNMVERMALFIGLFYGKYFLESPLPAASPMNDLNFYYFTKQLKTIDDELASAVLKSVERHLDYLSTIYRGTGCIFSF